MRFLKLSGVMLLCLFAFGLAAMGENAGSHDVNRVAFADPIRVGGALLPPGEYVVRHIMEGPDHIMVFEAVNHKHPDVKAKCQLVELGKKADQTRTVYDLNSAKERVLQELVFRGDSVKHVF
jgi:hypothetical protein